MSYFFTSTELPLRLALFWMANRLTDVISPLLAYGLLRLRGYHGYEGWRWSVSPRARVRGACSDVHSRELRRRLT